MIRRVYGRAMRVAETVASRLYLSILIIPLLWARGLVTLPFTVHLANGNAIIFCPHRIYKVALSKKSTVAVEERNYSLARQRWPQLEPVLPDIEGRDGCLASYLSMRRYRPVGRDESIDRAVAIYALMRTCRAPSTGPVAFEDSAELGTGIKAVTSLYGSETSRTIRQHVESYLRSLNYHVGFAHGDFHSRNILVDHRGEHKLVDFDCVRFNGIQELDALYFALEWEWSRSGALWYTTIVDLLRDAPSTECSALLAKFGVRSDFSLAATYLVDRIGQDIRLFGYRYNHAILDPAILAICRESRMVHSCSS